MTLSNLRSFGKLMRWHQSRFVSQFSTRTGRKYPFGIAFDIDGVLVRGGEPIPGAPRALRQLYQDFENASCARIPFLFLTNGGGTTEFKKALELSNLLNIKILPDQVLLGHTPFRNLIGRFGTTKILAVGKGEPGVVMTNYGYQNVVVMEEFVMRFNGIDPLARYKNWPVIDNVKCKQLDNTLKDPRAVDAVFIVSDPVDWSRDIQVLCDVLRSGGLPGRRSGPQPPIFFASDDFEYPSTFPVERFGMGAFRIALEVLYNRIGKEPLQYVSYGKPNVIVYRGAEAALMQIAQKLENEMKPTKGSQDQAVGFENIYMIGDNPTTDILGARQAGKPWFSILTRTGCFKGKDNHDLYPADLVVENVEQAIQFILNRHYKDLECNISDVGLH